MGNRELSKEILSKMTVLYHGSPFAFQTANCRLLLQNAHRGMDFGKGAYLSYSYENARQIALKKRSSGYVYTYYIDMKYAKERLNIRCFRYASIAWLDFVIENRLNICRSNKYDIVIGPTADALINKIIARADGTYPYMTNEEKSAMLREIAPYRYATQVCILTERANDFLIFRNREKVYRNDVSGYRKRYV